MSRAFVKDDSDAPEAVIERPAAEGPNYVTPQGLERLQRSLERAQSAGDERNSRYYRDRIATALVVEAAPANEGVVDFGASVTAWDESGVELNVRIVGADEADPARGAISFDSPIARAFTGHCEGETVAVQRPAGTVRYRIEKVVYE